MIIEQRTRRDVKEVTGFDPFKKTRLREYVEARALYIHILHKYHKKGCSEISRGLNLHHATILHSLKNFDIYVRYNKKLEESLYSMIQLQNKDHIAMKREYIKLKVDYLLDEDVLELSNQVRDMYEEALIKENEELHEVHTNEG